MGFTIYYRSTEAVEPDRADAIRSAADDVNRDRTWLSCEGVDFFDDDDEDGRLFGGSKPNFQPHPADAAAAAAEGLPDGTVRDLIDALCELSRAHNVDWEFSHDEDPGPIGFIRNGVADAALIGQINALAQAVAAIQGEFEFDVDDFNPADEPPGAPDDDDDDGDDEPPPTIRLWTGDE